MNARSVYYSQLRGKMKGNVSGQVRAYIPSAIEFDTMQICYMICFRHFHMFSATYADRIRHMLDLAYHSHTTCFSRHIDTPQTYRNFRDKGLANEIQRAGYLSLRFPRRGFDGNCFLFLSVSYPFLSRGHVKLNLPFLCDRNQPEQVAFHTSFPNISVARKVYGKAKIPANGKSGLN